MEPELQKLIFLSLGVIGLLVMIASGYSWSKNKKMETIKPERKEFFEVDKKSVLKKAKLKFISRENEFNQAL